ncbi:MAG: class I SAM-dependent methyltransferase [Sphingomonadales bacterium]
MSTASKEPPEDLGASFFGSREVDPDEKAALVARIFERVAERYDLMNDLMSGGVHRLWKTSFVDQLAPRAGRRYLDVAGGTGDIALKILERLNRAEGPETGKTAEVIVADINPTMLKVGRDRAMDLGKMGEISWTAGDAENLPFPDRSMDAYTIAFGIRNVTHIEAALEEAYRVLAPGGAFLCLEFSKLGSGFLQRLYDRYSEKVIPRLGKWITGDRAGYEYLVESIRRFPNQERLAGLIAGAGFSRVGYRDLSGGVVAIHHGHRI